MNDPLYYFLKVFELIFCLREDPESGSIIPSRQHHRNNHDRQKSQPVTFGEYKEPRTDVRAYQSTSKPEVCYIRNRHSTENIFYGEDYEEGIHPLNGERRHSISSDYASEFGFDERNLGRERSMTDRNALKQSWYKTIRNRYQMAGRGMKKDIQFPKSIDNYRTKYSEIKNTIIRSGIKFWEDADKRRLTERRKKTVRFDGGHDSSGSFDAGWMTLGNVDRWDSLRQGSQDSGTKDSGIETSSNFTSSEDSNRDFKVLKRRSPKQNGEC